MNRRERVITALSHKEPDRVPLDLGSTCDSSISALTYQQLRTSLNLKPNITRVVDVLQQGTIIDVDVLESLNVDLMFLFNWPKTWRKNLLADGTPALFPSKFRDISSIDGSREVFDKNGNIIYRMPSGGFYFEPVYRGLARVQDVTELPKYKDLLLSYDAPFYTNMSFEILAEKAKSIREQTDFALVVYFGGHILQAGQVLRGWEQFLIDL